MDATTFQKYKLRTCMMAFGCAAIAALCFIPLAQIQGELSNGAVIPHIVELERPWIIGMVMALMGFLASVSILIGAFVSRAIAFRREEKGLTA